MPVFLKSSHLQYILKSQFHADNRIYVVWVGLFKTRARLEKVPDLRARSSEGILLGRHLMADLFQHDSQTADLRQSLC